MGMGTKDGSPIAVVILAAGQGTRMKSALAKVLHPIAGRPMLGYPLAAAEALGAERIVVVVGRDAEQVEAAFAGRAAFALQREQRGTGHALLQAEAALGDYQGDLLVLYGDTPLLRASSLREMVERKRATGADLVLLSARVPVPGIVVRDGAGRLARIVEATDATPAELAIPERNTGVYLAPRALFWKALAQVDDRNAQGEIEAVYTIAFDIHEDVLEREQLLEARQHLSRFTEHIPYPLTYVDREYRLRFVNLAYQQAVGMSAAALLGRPIGEVRGPARWAQHQPFFDRALAGESVQYTRLVNDLPQGARWMRTSYVPDFDDAGQVQGVYTVTIDVHDLTEAQQRLARTAERDALTDALSRRTMMERIDAAAASCSNQPVGLFFIDLDGFKALNDSHGHAAGDALLVALAQALQQAVRAEDAVGRFGGDEFLVLAGVRDVAGAGTLASHLLGAVRECASQCPGAGNVSASIGYALAPHDATQPLRLLQLADGAMYAAKHAGKNRVTHCGASA